MAAKKGEAATQPNQTNPSLYGLAIDFKESLVKRNTLQYFIFYCKDTFKKPQYLVPQESLLRHL